MGLKLRIGIEVALAVVIAGLCLLTLLWPAWIEAVFKIDLDEGGGALERWVCIMSGLGAATFSALARWEWVRSRPVGSAR